MGIIGDKTPKGMLDTDTMRHLTATVEGMKIGEKKERKKEDEFRKREECDLL